jgi:hypothetical protein
MSILHTLNYRSFIQYSPTGRETPPRAGRKRLRFRDVSEDQHSTEDSPALWPARSFGVRPDPLVRVATLLGVQVSSGCRIRTGSPLPANAPPSTWIRARREPILWRSRRHRPRMTELLGVLYKPYGRNSSEPPCRGRLYRSLVVWDFLI